jgi:hypothetical protein
MKAKLNENAGFTWPMGNYLYEKDEIVTAEDCFDTLDGLAHQKLCWISKENKSKILCEIASLDFIN